MTGEWLTYAQAGERFGLSADAVRMRVHRLGWRTQPGNDGRTLVLVPEDAAVQPRRRSPERSEATRMNVRPHKSPMMANWLQPKAEQYWPNKGPNRPNRGRIRLKGGLMWPTLTDEPQTLAPTLPWPVPTLLMLSPRCRGPCRSDRSSHHWRTRPGGGTAGEAR